MNRIKTILLVAITAFAIYAAPASATPIVGQVTDADGNVIAGAQSANGTVLFYIPLDGERDFDGSLPQDSCRTWSSNPSNQCGGGTLNLYMHFSAGGPGAMQVIIDFDDFDHEGYGDNNYFSELLQIIITDADGDVFVFDYADIAGLISGTSDTQQLTLDIEVSGEFDVQFIFDAGFADGTTGGFYNTLEGMRATAVSVPEPGTLALLGAGLLLLAFSRRRRTS